MTHPTWYGALFYRRTSICGAQCLFSAPEKENNCSGRRKPLSPTICRTRTEHLSIGEQLVKDILKLHQHAHHDGHPAEAIPPMPVIEHELSAREIEVLVLITKGFINKEIADKLNISLTTVITHRKNITEKLGIKSVSGLTIYAVMNGYVEADRI